MQKQPPEIITNGGNTEFVQHLNANGVAFVIVGGAAVAAHGCRDMNAVDDLDIVIDPTTDNVEKFIAVLAACHANFQHPVEALAKPGVQLPVKHLHYYLDVLTPRDTSFADMLAKSVPATLDGMTVRVAGRDDLIAMKRFAIAQNDASREKHEADLARLLPRTTAIGLLTDAKQMLLAASILHDSGEWKVQGPTYYLLGHATELALKSFLLANGDSLDRLRQRIGHNLAKAARRVRATKCNPLAQTVTDHFDAIELLSFYYEAKELEYRVTGVKTYPAKETLFSFLRAAIPMIEPHAMRVYPDR